MFATRLEPMLAVVHSSGLPGPSRLPQGRTLPSFRVFRTSAICQCWRKRSNASRTMAASNLEALR